MKLPVLTLIGLGLLASCSKSDTTLVTVIPPVSHVDSMTIKKDTTEDVYVVGQTSTQVGYFKNSQFVSLATGSNPLGVDMAFSGTDIYVLGEVNDSIGYWKNGQFNFLALADSVAPVSMALVGTDVFSFLQQETGSWPGDLYQNTDFYSELPTANLPGLTSIYANGSDLYVPGSNSGIHSNAVYWLNGISNQLPDSRVPGHAYAMTVNGSDIYAVGSTYDYTDSTEIATCWKNNVPYYMSDSLSFSRIYYISIANGVTYMAGYQAAGNASHYSAGPVSAVIWKNGIATPLTPAGFSDSILGFAVNGSDVYVSVISTAAGNSYGTAHYYKNGQVMNYTGNTVGYGSRIFVRPR